MEDTQLLKEAYEDIVKRKGNDWKNFLDEGSDFLTEKTTQAYDLDIFGIRQLRKGYQHFHLTNRF